MAPATAAPEHEDSEINLTPMLDVVFIMLIFFIVAATFLDESGLPVGSPAPPMFVAPETETITVTVGANSTFNVNGRVMAGASVAPYVRRLRSELPDASFAVLVEPGSRVKDTARAIDAGRLSGFDIVPIAAVP